MLERKNQELDFEIEFLEAILKGSPDNIDCLRAVGHMYTQDSRWKEGLETDLRLVGLLPEDPVVRYNLACSLSLTDSADEALEMLRQAVSLGYRDFEYMRQDPDLAAVRSMVGFDKLLETGNA